MKCEHMQKDDPENAVCVDCSFEQSGYEDWMGREE